MTSPSPTLIHMRAAYRADARRGRLPIVRTLNQRGPSLKEGYGIRLFLDDVRNPPYMERHWMVVRDVATARDFIYKHGEELTEISLDNDLGAGPEGYVMIPIILALRHYLPNLQVIYIHSSNLPRVRLMRRMLQGSGYKVIRREPSGRMFPHHRSDIRDQVVYIAE